MTDIHEALYTIETVLAAECPHHAPATRPAMRSIRAALEQRRVPHQCKPLARAYMAEGRDWWVGQLIEPVEEWPQESFCLHMATPIKDVEFLCNRADFEQLSLLCRAVTGPLNPTWVDRMVANVTKRAAAPEPGERE